MASSSDYGYYDNLRLTPSTLLGRAGNVNLHRDARTDEQIGICHIHGLIWIEEDVYSIDSVAAALLAMHILIQVHRANRNFFKVHLMYFAMIKI